MTPIRIRRGAAVALLCTTVCLLPDASARGRPPSRPDARTALVRRQAESGLTLVTYEDGELKYVDFRTTTTRTLQKLAPDQRPESHYALDYSKKLLVGTRSSVAGGDTLFSVNLADGSVTPLAVCHVEMLSLSPDGRAVVYVRWSARRGTNFELWRVDLGTKAAEMLSPQVRRGSEPQWSADGRFILYDYFDPQSPDDWAVVAYDTAAKTERVLSKKAFLPSWEHRGRQYVYWDGFDIVRSSLAEDGRREKVKLGGITPPQPNMPARYSRTGEFMAYLRGSPGDILNIKGCSWVDLMVKGDAAPVRVFGPYERNKRLTFFWAEVPAAKQGG
jgi:dipeptidyl aminopeptidase/acylaminoacyl peptidase